MPLTLLSCNNHLKCLLWLSVLLSSTVITFYYLYTLSASGSQPTLWTSLSIHSSTQSDLAQNMEFSSVHVNLTGCLWSLLQRIEGRIKCNYKICCSFWRNWSHHLIEPARFHLIYFSNWFFEISASLKSHFLEGKITGYSRISLQIICGDYKWRYFM